ncbi:MAG: hypothetical protein AMXMBFR13_11610 [Phycisphaerae bacterium]
MSKLLGVGVVAVAWGLLSGGARAEEPLRLEAGPHLFIDDHLIARQSGLRRVIVEPVRLPEPVVTGPEDKCFQPYVTVLRDPATKRFRIWYGIPENESRSHLGYMESDDGIRWQRPHRVLKDPAHIQFGVSILDDGPDCKDAAQRYKYGFWDAGGLQIAVSPDGLDWTMLAPTPVLEHDHDINCIFRDPVRNRYMALVSTYTEGPAWPGKRRIPMMSVSDDLLHWEKPWVIIRPDGQDEGETQFYCMGGLIARGPLLIGMLRVLRDDLPADPGGDVRGLGYTVLAWSRDGRTWQRDREPFLPRNPKPGTWDHAMTWADCQLPVDDEMYIYYGGYARGHKVDRFTERQIGLARMPVDRYVAREADGQEGRLLTKPLLLKGKALTLNASVKGRLRVRVCDLEGNPLDGFDWRDGPTIEGDSVHHRLAWKGGTLPASSQPVRLEFGLQDGRVFGFSLQ